MDYYDWNYDWEKTKSRLSALWENELVDRACIAIPVTDGDAYEPITTMADNLSQKELKMSYTEPYYISEHFRNKMLHTRYMGDALPCIFPNFGTNGFVQYAGAQPVYKPDTIWYAPILDEPNESLIAYHEDVFNEHMQIIHKLVELSKDEYFISMPDHCGILD